MKGINIIVLICVIITIAVNCKGKIDVAGKIYIVGNEPFTEVAIETEDGKTYVLVGELADSLRTMQGQIVEITGKLGGKTAYTKQSVHVGRYKCR